ncbi:MAG: hypothetical protein AAF571_05795 [Verrucomicrobiota bacterium]
MKSILLCLLSILAIGCSKQHTSENDLSGTTQEKEDLIKTMADPNSEMTTKFFRPTQIQEMKDEAKPDK